MPLQAKPRQSQPTSVSAVLVFAQSGQRSEIPPSVESKAVDKTTNEMRVSRGTEGGPPPTTAHITARRKAREKAATEKACVKLTSG